MRAFPPFLLSSVKSARMHRDKHSKNKEGGGKLLDCILKLSPSFKARSNNYRLSNFLAFTIIYRPLSYPLLDLGQCYHS